MCFVCVWEGGREGGREGGYVFPLTSGSLPLYVRALLASLFLVVGFAVAAASNE